ncbi:hypothetical protein [Streptomyces sp. DH24]|uniref:hypothetical protein n=1 Tax=Streptomyces sp. DH24 TaxID=3040123 RepID=UPI00244248B9|nr:hypothetical protein [Streptomyces sp. DH24]MDG9718112.1 hypothetical protein [Streptomyces sp. DH24]
MSWTRGILAVLAVCVTLSAGSAGCGSGDARETGNGESPAAVGRLLDETDEEGRRYREIGGEHAPRIGIEVQPEDDGSWDVRLRLRDFRLSPPGERARAVPGQGLAHLYVDGRLVTRLHTREHRLPAVPRGTHHVTARLYADDGTVWAVDGEPVESTAAITVSRPGPAPGARGADAGPGG